MSGGWGWGGGGGHQMVGRLNWMPPPYTIPAIVLSKFSATSQCVQVFAGRLSGCFRPCSLAVLPYVHWSISSQAVN